MASSGTVRSTTRAPDPAARRDVIKLGEASSLTIDRFPDYDELVELHVVFLPGVWPADHVFELGAPHARARRPRGSRASSNRVCRGGGRGRRPARALQPPSARAGPDELAAEIVEFLLGPLGAERDEYDAEARGVWRLAEHRADDRVRRARQAWRIKALRDLVADWDSRYDEFVGRESERREAVAKQFNIGARQLGDRLAEAKRAGLTYRGMRG